MQVWLVNWVRFSLQKGCPQSESTSHVFPGKKPSHPEIKLAAAINTTTLIRLGIVLVLIFTSMSGLNG
jgi:hypothetical protein